MSKAPLPNTVDPRRSADQGLSFQGCVPLKRFQRLATYLVEQEGVVNVSLTFGVDEERIRYLNGTAEASVQMLCQRCLEPVAIGIKAELNLGIVRDDEAAQMLPRRYDPLVVDHELDVSEAIEEELILTLPLIATHEDCEVKTDFRDPDAKPEGDDKPNPFSVLAQLKGNKH
ncbi:MAG: YceD family protein [Motiliproteus sp.]|nr:YceD family protein [Motiliproteus sp.]MCW9052962.1 YceD family protein [Motiliproteus sp.]